MKTLELNEPNYTRGLSRHTKLARGLLCLWLGPATLLVGQATLHAGNLYVPNSSFESPTTQFADPRVDFWQKAPQPPGFDTNIFGAWENLSGLFFNPPSTNAGHIDNAEGNQLAYLFAYPQAAIFQDYNSIDWSNSAPSHAFAARFEVGKSYTVAAGFTSSSQEPLTDGSAALLSVYYRDSSNHIVTVASTNVIYQTSLFTNLTHLLDFQVKVPPVKPNDAWAGQNIGIQFESIVEPSLLGGVWDLDNIRLTETIEVPNFSFESVATQFADPRIDAWQKVAQPATFDTNIFGDWDNLGGVFQNPAPTNVGHIDNADGNQLRTYLPIRRWHFSRTTPQWIGRMQRRHMSSTQNLSREKRIL